MHKIKIIHSNYLNQIFINFVFLFFSQFLYSKGNVTILCYDSETFQFSNLESLSNSICRKTKKRLNNVGIYHYVNPKFSLNQKEYDEGRCNITYKSIHLSCDQELCALLEQDYTRFSGNLNKVIVCGELNCLQPKKWSVETIYYPNVDEEKIAEKIALDLKSNNKNDLDFIIVIPGNSSKTPLVKFETDILEVISGVPFKLSPILNNKENIKEYLWTSTEKIDYPTIENPTITLSKNTEFSLKITDNRGCSHVDSIKIVVKKSSFVDNELQNENIVECKCNNGVTAIKMLSENELNRAFKKTDFLEFIYKGDSNWEGIKISQNKSSSAERTFDIPFKLINDCVSEFKVKITDTRMRSQTNIDNNSPWEEKYYMDDINNENRRYRKEGFVTFTVDLTSMKGLDAGTSYLLIIESYDSKNNQCAIFKSSALRFIPCSSKE
jgi:hypothetical protein